MNDLIGADGELPLGVSLMAHGPVAGLLDDARLAEAVGCRRCWVYDEGLATRDAWVTMTAVALSTSRIRIGPGITNPYTRHPGTTAAALASLDEVSGGRAFLGIGAGGGMTLGPLGIDRIRPLEAVEKTVTAVRGLLDGRSLDMSSSTFSLRTARMGYGRPGIEVLLAGRGPRMADLGGRIGDGYVLSWIHRDFLGAHVEALRTAGAARGRPLTLVWSTMPVVDESDFLLARESLTFRLADSPSSVKERIGMSDKDTTAIRAALRDGGPPAAAHLVREEWVDPFVVTGRTDSVGEIVRSTMHRLGIDEFQLPHVADLGAALELLAPAFPKGEAQPG